MNCPACNRPFTTKFVCPICWERVPPKDRIWLYDHKDAGPKTLTSKLDKVIRELKAK